MKRRRRMLDTPDDDIRDHIDRETRDNLDRGMAPDEARRQAILTFGNVALVKEDTRAIWGWQRLEQLSSFLVDVDALDPIAFAAAGAALFGVGVAAAFVPALRAGTADPLTALREQ
jgi:hypothetical protein